MDSIDYLLTGDSPRVDQPDGIELELKPHQLASLYKICMIDRDCGMTMKSQGIKFRSNVGVLADLAGYGKTITFLSLIVMLKEKETRWMPDYSVHKSNGYGVAVGKYTPMTCVEASLIVVPDNLVDHWELHMEAYTELSFDTVDSGNYGKINIEECDVVLCPASHYNNFIRKNDYYWNRVAFDEADSINIPNTRMCKARFLWMITATFESMPSRKNKGFLRDIFSTGTKDLAFGEIFTPVVVKGDINFVKASFNMPEPNIHYLDCQAPKILNAIRNHVDTEVIEYMNAGDMDNAILALGGNLDTDRNIIDLVSRGMTSQITKLQKKLDKLDDRTDLDPEELADKKGKIEEQLASLNTRYDTLKTNVSEVANSDCPICYCDLDEPVITSCCNNITCSGCLLEWLKTNNSCPLCRSAVDVSKLYKITTETKLAENVGKDDTKTKLETMVDIIKSNPDGKFIVFSGHNGSFKDITDTLEQEDVTYDILTQSVKTKKVLDEFRNGDLTCILLNAENNGAGIDLHQATDVILYHQMRNCLEIQTIARAQRPGREGVLQVWKLKYPNEYVKESKGKKSVN